MKPKRLIIFLGNDSRHVSMLQTILIEKKEESKENHVTKYAAKQRKGHCVGHELGQESQLPSSWEWERTTGPHFPLPQLRLRFHRKCRCSKVGAGNEVPWCVDLDAAYVRRKTHFFFNIVITIWE